MRKVDTIKSNSRAFTMIELIFVIVIMGILSKFGVEFLAQAYNSFIFSSINNSLQSRSASALETIGARLQFRIKDSVIARNPGVSFQGIGDSTLGANATVLEWVGMDVDGLRGDVNATWGGIIDLDASNAFALSTPNTNMTDIFNKIDALSNNTAGVNDAAIYFVGSDSDIQNGYGWDGNPIVNQNATMHPIRMAANDIFIPTVGAAGGIGADNNFTGVDVYEYYQLAWTAYAVSLEDFDGDGNASELVLYFNYQPWQGDDFANQGTAVLLMENVDTFRFKSVGSVMKLQICVFSTVISGDNNDSAGGYSLCKEKTIY